MVIQMMDMECEVLWKNLGRLALKIVQYRLYLHKANTYTHLAIWKYIHFGKFLILNLGILAHIRINLTLLFHLI